jgi:curved DNA-binding protein CbpA
LSNAQMRTPRPVADRRTAAGLSLSSTDGFVLSRIDGTLSEQELAATTGLSEELVGASLAKLEAFGLITFGQGPPAPTASGTVPSVPKTDHSSPAPSAFSSAPVGPSVSSAPPDAATPVATSPPPHVSFTTDAPLAPEDEAALAEDVELDEDLRRQVINMHRKLDRLDHYALLGVDRTADRKTIKRAYYDLAGRFHPDRYFRKSLGSFKVRLEAIFSRVTLSHDTLSDREKRVEYDAYIEERRRSRGLEELMSDALDEVRRIEANVERQVREQERSVTPMSTPSLPVGAVPAKSPAATAPTPNVDVAARRDALARRLLGGRAPTVSSAPPASPAASIAPTPLTTTDAMASLRRRYEERVLLAKGVEARKYVANAEAALAANDPVAASNAFRIALKLVPGDADLERRAQETQIKADVLLSETYTRQARYEEKNEQWDLAARSWSRVCRGRPGDALAHDRAASAIVKAGGDLHEASRLANRACELDANSAAFRVTLASVFEAAGLGLNARRELERAAQLAPQDDTIRVMLKRV